MQVYLVEFQAACVSNLVIFKRRKSFNIKSKKKLIISSNFCYKKMFMHTLVMATIFVFYKIEQLIFFIVICQINQHSEIVESNLKLMMVIWARMELNWQKKMESNQMLSFYSNESVPLLWASFSHVNDW